MRCVCYICGAEYRVKPPLDDDRVSHGLCEGCFRIEMEKIERKLAILMR